MTKTKDTTLTAFGRLLERLEMEPGTAAAELGITRQYVWALSTGNYPGGPGWKLREKIRDWAADKGGRVAVDSWPAPNAQLAKRMNTYAKKRARALRASRSAT